MIALREIRAAQTAWAWSGVPVALGHTARRADRAVYVAGQPDGWYALLTETGCPDQVAGPYPDPGHLLIDARVWCALFDPPAGAPPLILESEEIVMPLPDPLCGQCHQPITGWRDYLTTVTQQQPGHDGRRALFHFGCLYPAGPPARLPLAAADLVALTALDPVRAAYFFDADRAQLPPPDASAAEWTHWHRLQHARFRGAADYAQHPATIHNPYPDPARRWAWAQGYVDAARATGAGWL